MTTTTDNDMNERKARLAYADEANWFTLPGRAGVYDPVVGFEWAPHSVIVYGTPTRSRGGAGPSDLTVTAPTGTSAPIGRSRPPRPSRTLGGNSSGSSGASGRPAMPPTMGGLTEAGQGRPIVKALAVANAAVISVRELKGVSELVTLYRIVRASGGVRRGGVRRKRRPDALHQ